MDKLPNSSEATETGSLAVIVDSVGVFLGKVPAVLQRNVAKAVGHLFKVPNAYLDGLAEELKATSAARVKIIKSTGAKLAEAVEVDSSLAEIATQTHANKILRHQKNAIRVLRHAAEELESMPTDETKEEPKEIKDDWLNAFESEAINMSSEQMQKLFGKMLAGEIRQPSTFSIRTVKLMGQMDTDVAELFRQFCSLTSSLQMGSSVIDGRLLVLKNNGSPLLHDLGMTYGNLLTLQEYGLIVDAEATKFPYDMCILGSDNGKPKLALTYNSVQYVLIPKPPKTAEDFGHFLQFGIALSRVGRELLNVVELQENQQYSEAFNSFFDQEHLVLYKIPESNQAKEKA